MGKAASAVVRRVRAFGIQRASWWKLFAAALTRVFCAYCDQTKPKNGKPPGKSLFGFQNFNLTNQFSSLNSAATLNRKSSFEPSIASSKWDVYCMARSSLEFEIVGKTGSNPASLPVSRHNSF